MVGAFIADGHLKERECFWSNNRKAKHYELVFREEYESNMRILARWINNVFEIGVSPEKKDNHYKIYISNKIVFRYFQIILGFSSGKKTDTVSIPRIFSEAEENIKKALIKGILMFDGSVARKNGYVELYSKSKVLIEDVSQMLKEINIKPGYISSEKDKYGRSRVIVRKQKELLKMLELFEKNTVKYDRLKKISERFKKR